MQLSNINHIYNIQSFKGKPLYEVKIPKLEGKSYKPTPVVFTKLDPKDISDIQMVKKNRLKFFYGFDFDIPRLFLSRHELYQNTYDFFALESPTNNNDRLLGLACVKKQSAFGIKKSMYLDKLSTRKDLKKYNIFRFGKRKFKNVGELMMYGLAKNAAVDKKGMHWKSGSNGFYDALGLSEGFLRRVSLKKLPEFLKRVEVKFRF